MAVEIYFQDFLKVLNLQVSFNGRFGCPRVFAVAFLKPEKKELFTPLKKVIHGALRETDILSTIDESLFLILPETDKNGADFISRAIYDFFKGEVVEVYVDFPEDGKTSQDLIKTLEERTKNKFGYFLEKYFRK